MASQKPKLEEGFLGMQPAFSDSKLKLDSHKDCEFRVFVDNTVVIKLKTGIPVKVVTRLTQCGTEKEYGDQYVLVQRKDTDYVYFHVGFPDDGWYKFMIFALPEKDSKESLPNVVNYLINVERMHRPAQPFVKVYTKFYKDCCYLEEPLSLNQNTLGLDRCRFSMTVPDAQKVAVHAGEEWFQLNKKGGKWEGSADLYKYKGKDTKVTVNANYEKEGNSYSVLLEYKI